MFFGAYKNKTVLVTGNTGFKGSWLSLWLKRLGANVIGISDRIPTEPSLFEVAGLQDQIDHRFEDVRNQNEIRKVIEQVEPDFIFHLAAQALVREAYADPLKTISTNALGTASILDAVRAYSKPCHIVLITSDKCYENKEWVWGYRENEQLGGKDPYSASKAAAEICARAFYYSYFSSEKSPIRMVTARAGNVIGGGDWAKDRLVPDAVRAWSKQQAIEIRSPKSTRPWQHVLEPLSGYLSLGVELALSRDLCGQSFNFGPAPDQDKTVLELLEAIAESWQLPSSSDAIRYEEDTGMYEAKLLKLNCDLAASTLHWRPVLNFEQTAQFTAEWYLNFYKEKSKSILDFTLEQLARYETLAMKKGLRWTKQSIT